MTDPYAHRRGLTFGQAEGVEDLPRQLELREVSKELRAKLQFGPYEESGRGPCCAGLR